MASPSIMENRPGGIIWHHTGDPHSGPQADTVNASHRARNFPLSSLGFYGGYHILIEKDGTLVRFRNDNEIGAHCLNHNVDTLGICMAGNFDVEAPTSEQCVALGKQVFDWQKQYMLPTTQIRPHRYFRATDCPGKQLRQEWLWDIIGQLAQEEYDAANK